MNDDNQIKLLNRALERERQARKTAEALLESKSRELFDVNTALKNNQTQLVHSEKMASLGQLAAGVAHEINNPIAFVRSNVGTLGEYVATFSQLIAAYDAVLARHTDCHNSDEYNALNALREHEDVDFITDDSTQLITETLTGLSRVCEIVNNLRTFARLDEDEFQEVDIRDCIESTLKIASNELKYTCTVTQDLAETSPIECWPGQLNQVILNLLVNAKQAMDPNGGEIIIQTNDNDDTITLNITDHGCGIPEELCSSIFQPFFTTKPVNIGTGMGLAITHGIIEKHNGTISVSSVVDGGTTFTITLPKRQHPPQ